VEQSTIPNVYAEWVKKALDLHTGQFIYINVETRAEQLSLLKNINRELERYKTILPIESATLVAGKIFKDTRFWVYLKRAAATPFIGFLKDTDGSLKRISIHEEDDERLRRLQLMVSDNFSLEEIEESEGSLSDTDKEKLWPHLKQEASDA